MLHQGHRGWGRFPSSKMTTVSRTCWCRKWTRIAVLVAARPRCRSSWVSLNRAAPRASLGQEGQVVRLRFFPMAEFVYSTVWDTCTGYYAKFSLICCFVYFKTVNVTTFHPNHPPTFELPIFLHVPN